MDSLDLLQIVAAAVFLLVVLGQTLRMQIGKGTNPITLRVRGKGLLGISEVVLLALVNLWLAAVLLYVLPLQNRPLALIFEGHVITSTAARMAGAAMIVAGFFLFASALHALGDSWRLGIDSRNPGALVTRGIYAHSRNPIYVFFYLYFVGTVLVNGALIFLVFAVPVIAILHYQVLEEEKFLIQVHGEVYRAYRARVGRYANWNRVPVPRIRRAKQPSGE